MVVVFLDLSKLKIWPLRRRDILYKSILGRRLIEYVVDWIETEFGSITKIHALCDFTRIDEIRFGDKKYTIRYFDLRKPNEEVISKFIMSRGAYENLFLAPLDFFVKVYELESIFERESERTPIIFHGDPEELRTKIMERGLVPKVIYSWQILVMVLELAKKLLRGEAVEDSVEINENAVIKAPCRIEGHVKIFENAVLKPPCFIGKNSIIGNNAIIRGSIIEENSIIGANMEVARSWLGVKTETHSGYIGDSLFTERVHTGAGFITANLRIDQKTVKVYYEDMKIDTGLEKLGAIVGSHVEFGIHSGTMPGILVGNNVIVGPGTLLFENVPDNTKVYMKYLPTRKPI